MIINSILITIIILLQRTTRFNRKKNALYYYSRDVLFYNVVVYIYNKL